MLHRWLLVSALILGGFLVFSYIDGNTKHEQIQKVGTKHDALKQETSREFLNNKSDIRSIDSSLTKPFPNISKNSTNISENVHQHITTRASLQSSVDNLEEKYIKMWRTDDEVNDDDDDEENAAFKNKGFDDEIDLSEAARCRKERNQLSKQLNDLKRKYGQQFCELMSLKGEVPAGQENGVSEFGGWCQRESEASSRRHTVDHRLVRGLSMFLEDKTVASFGEGPGLYKDGMERIGSVKSYTAYDGAPFVEKVTNGSVQFLDLTSPQFGLPVYDWVLCLEVGEHIPKQFEDVFLDNLARHANEGIIMSWAQPGQKGFSHVNNKSPKDVEQMMKGRGFEVDHDMTHTVSHASLNFFLRQNIRVYVRVDVSTLNWDDA